MGPAFFGFFLGLLLFMGQHAEGIKTTSELFEIAGIISAVFAAFPLVWFILGAWFSLALEPSAQKGNGGSTGTSDSHGGGYTSGGTSGGGDCGGGGGDC